MIFDNKDINFDINSISALALAFVGDSVFDLFIRTKLVGSGKKVRDLHREAVELREGLFPGRNIKKHRVHFTQKRGI